METLLVAAHISRLAVAPDDADSMRLKVALAVSEDGRRSSSTVLIHVA
jgi:hypothetical protein